MRAWSLLPQEHCRTLFSLLSPHAVAALGSQDVTIGDACILHLGLFGKPEWALATERFGDASVLTTKPLRVSAEHGVLQEADLVLFCSGLARSGAGT